LDTLVVLLLIGMFVLLSTGVLVLGISVYNNTNRVSSENFLHRTALSYVANQIRRSDAGGGIEVRELEGTEALVFRQNFDGTDYLTWLYCYDGQLRELFSEEGFEQALSSGTEIMPLESLSFAIEGGTIDVTVTEENGDSRSLILSPRSGINGGRS
jgi:hypothetical protein